MTQDLLAAVFLNVAMTASDQELQNIGLWLCHQSFDGLNCLIGDRRATFFQ